MIFKSLIVSLFFFFQNFAIAQSAETITFKIMEKGSGKTLNHVQVSLRRDKKKWESNKDGIVSLSIPSSGDGTIQFTLGGYEILEAPFKEFRPAGTFDIYLIPSVEGENLILVTGKKEGLQISRKTISIEEASKVAPNADPVQIIKLLPGVQSRPFRPQPIIRGSGPKDSKYYIDQFEVPYIFHGIGDLSVIPGSMIQDVRFDSGGFAADKGDATGGIIIVKTRTEIPERPKTEFVLNVPFYSGIFHTRPLSDKEGLTVGVRKSYVDIIIKQILHNRNKKNGKTEGELTLVPYFGDGQAVYWIRNDNSYTKYSLIGAYDGLKAAFPFSEFANLQGQASVAFDTRFINFGIEHNQKISHGWTLISAPQLYYENTSANIFGQTFSTPNWGFRVPIEAFNKLNTKQNINIGIDPVLHIYKVKHNAIVYNNSDPTFDPEDAPIIQTKFSLKFINLASWLNFDQKFEKLTLSPGLRFFQNGEIKKVSADPRLRGQYSLNEKNTLKSAIGQYSESPSVPAASPQIGNPQLGFQRSYHYILGLETRWNDNWLTEFQVYYKTAFNIVANDPLTQYNNKGSFKSSGFEAFIRRNLTERLFAWLSYTFSRTVSRNSSRKPYTPSQFDETHNLYIVSNYKLSTRWEIGGRFNFHTGDTYTPISYGVYNSSLDKYDGRILENSEYSARLPSFNSLSFYFDHDWLFNTWKLNLRFGMESYWVTPQVLDINYNYDFTKTSQETSLSNIPFLELRGEF